MALPSRPLRLCVFLLFFTLLPPFPLAHLPPVSRLDLSSLENLVAGVWGEFKSLLNARLGDTRDSIVPLKKYFAQFGYLNLTNGENVTALFDDDTEAAVKLYQESFNLSVSGVLDLKTLLQIMKPRCGREDVVDGIPLMLQSISGNSPGASSRPAHTVGHSVARYVFFPGSPRWPSSRRNLTYAFNSANETQRVNIDQRRQAFANAFIEWAAVVPINFTEIQDFESADIKIEFVSFAHGDEEPFDGVLGILAHAFSPVDGRFHLDDSEYWSTYTSTDGGPDNIDLQSVATHEIGHLIGLGHTPVQSAIMYPSISPREVKIELQADDIQGAQALYGANPDYNPNNPLPGVPPNLENVSGADSLLRDGPSLFRFMGSFLLLVFLYSFDGSLW